MDLSLLNIVLGWRDWTLIGALIAMFFGGGTFAYNRIKGLIKFLDGYDEIKKTVTLHAKNIEYIHSMVSGLIRLLHDPFFVCDSEGYCTEANMALCELFGATQEQMMGSGWSNFIVAADRERAWAEWITGVKTGSVDIVGFYKIRHGISRKTIDVTYRATIHHDKTGDVVVVCVGKAKEVITN
jgi:PAS domain S-box-containing protein